MVWPVSTMALLVHQQNEALLGSAAGRAAELTCLDAEACRSQLVLYVTVSIRPSSLSYLPKPFGWFCREDALLLRREVRTKAALRAGTTILARAWS